MSHTEPTPGSMAQPLPLLQSLRQKSPMIGGGAPPQATMNQNGVHNHASPREDAEWDAFIACHPFGHHEQSSRYGVLRGGYGFDCDRILLRDDGRIIGGAQVLSQRLPIGRIAVVQRGPLAINNEQTVLRELVTMLDQLARRRSFLFVRVDAFPGQSACREVLAEAGYQSAEPWFPRKRSLDVSLSQSDEQVLAGMKHKGRYNMRIAQREGVNVRVNDEQAIEDFYGLYRRTTNHQRIPAFPRSYFEYLQQVFGPLGKLHCFVAYHMDQPVAAIVNSIAGGRMIYGWGGMHRGERERRLMANYLLHYFAMGWAREHGCTHYDLCGVSQFKRRLSVRSVSWPAPLWKRYGYAGAVPQGIINIVGALPRVRRGMYAICGLPPRSICHGNVVPCNRMLIKT